MGLPNTLWSRWQVVAQRAAEVQANVLFFLLYYAAIVPMGLLRLGESPRQPRARGAAPGWTRRDPRAADLESSRRQF